VASANKHTPFVRPNNASPTQIASQGVASFYTEGQQTASGEKFDTHDLTAAHPTLPFGTRLRKRSSVPAGSWLAWQPHAMASPG
jgi:rare lipoprotein A